MKKPNVMTFIAGFVVLLGGSALAQDAPVPRIIPVDIIPCTFNEGKGMADLDAAVDKWTKYMDKSPSKNAYSAWTMHKLYAGPEQEFDFAWLGAWKDGNAMGKGWGDYMENGQKAEAAFNEVATCDAAGNYGSIRHKAPPEGTPMNPVMVFSDCKLGEGITGAMHAENMKKWAAVLDEAGIESGIFHWYPIFGAGGERTFDFKQVSTFSDLEAWGKMYEAMTNGGLYRTSREIFGDTVSCDVARVYNAQNRRFTELRPE